MIYKKLITYFCLITISVLCAAPVVFSEDGPVGDTPQSYDSPEMDSEVDTQMQEMTDAGDESASTDQSNTTDMATASASGSDMGMNTSMNNTLNLSMGMLKADLFTGKLISSAPIPVPPGRAGMTPQLEMLYKNNTDNHSNTWVGVGWVLETGYIQRSTKEGRPKYNDSDTFILSVNNSNSELVNIGGNEYRLKLGGNSLRVFKFTDHWEATDSTGKRYTFGSVEESRTGNSSRTSSWNLDRVEDISGNYMTLTYTKDTGYSYLDEIRYTGFGQDPGYYKIKFVLENTVRDDIVLRPSLIHDIRYRLKDIIVYANEQRIRRYSIQYRPISGFARRSLIETITQYGKDDITSLPPVTFQYQPYDNPLPGDVHQATLPGITDTNSYKTMGDFNSDGLLDICTYNKDTHEVKVLLKEKSGAFGSYNTWLTYNPTSGQSGSSDFEPRFFSGDFNGDARTDIAFYVAEVAQFTVTYKVMVGLSSGSSFSGPAQWWHKLIIPNGNYSLPPAPKIITGDFNGDGKTDLCYPGFGGFSGSFSTGSSFGTVNYWITGWNPVPAQTAMMAGDFNGDGISDIAAYDQSNGQWGFAISEGNGGCTLTFEGLSNFGRYGLPGQGFQQVLLGDFNGDGLTDLAQYDASNQLLDFAINNGKRFIRTSSQQMSFAVQGAYTADYTGDGITDVGNLNGSIFTWKDSVGLSSDQMIGINNGVGGTTEISYKPSSEYNNTDLPFTIQTIAGLTYRSQPTNQEHHVVYDFEGGLFNREDREFRGFEHVSVTDDYGNKTETFFLQDAIMQGRTRKQIYRDASGIIKTAAISEWQDRLLYGGLIHAPEAVEQRSYLVEQSTFNDQNPSYIKATRSTLVYDDYGNVIEAHEYGDIDDSSDDKSAYSLYTQNTTDWILNLPYETRLEDLSGQVVSKQRVFYDNSTTLGAPPIKGFPTVQQAWLNLPTEKWISSITSYNSYGNVIRTTDPRGNSIYTTYETTLNQYPTQITNELGHTQSFTYDYDTGQILTSTDPNGQITTNQYDTLGRLTQIFGPLDTDGLASVKYEYDTTTVPTRTTKSVKKEYGINDYLTSYAFTDGFGRTIQVKSPAQPEGGNTRQIVSGAVVYDEQGRVKEEYESYFDSPASADFTTPSYSQNKITYDYDSLGRVISVTAQNDNGDPIQTTNSYYAWQLTNTDPNGNSKETYYDAFKRLIQVREHNNFNTYDTYYVYDALGNLKQVTDNQGNITTISYDSLGRKLSMTDPDMGTWSYFYDDNGNLVSQTDNKSQTINFTYDALNRLVIKLVGAASGGDSTITYTYDQGINGQGRLNRVDYEGGSTEFFYDELGREIKTIKTIGSSSHAIERTYDALDRLKTLKYPDNETLTYAYDASGAIKSIEGLNQTYVQDITYSAQGQMTQLTYGNGAVTNYTYNAYTRRLSSLRANVGAASGREILDLSYTFDNVGNVTNIDDLKNSSSASYQYDDLYRLTRADNPSGYGTLDYTYDSIGNLTQKGTRTLSYGEGSAGPHAVTSYTSVGAVSDGEITYDTNGNMITKNDTTYEYDSENRLKRVETSQETVHDTFEIELSAGWNFFSLPVIPDVGAVSDGEYSITSVFSSILPNIKQITRLDPTTGKHESFTGNATFDQFQTIEYLRGYQVYCYSPCTVSITGSSPSSAYSLQLTAGSNLIGVDITNTGKSASAAFFNIDYTSIKWYNPTTEVLEDLNPSDTVEMGRAYIVGAASGGEYTVSAPQTITTFTYDGDGGRVTKNVNGTTTTYIGSLFEKQGNKTTRHIFLGDTRIASVIPAQAGIQFYHSDHLGSTTTITDQNGEVVQHTEYTPYGEFSPSVIPAEAGIYTSVTPYLYTGQLFDDSTNLYYYGARYYDPELGRFITSDTIVPDPTDPQAFDRYGYARGNPIRYTDPTGHSFIDKIQEWLGIIDDALAGLENDLEEATGCGWDFNGGGSYSTSFGAGANSGTPQTSPFQDMGGSYESEQSFDPFFDPIISPPPVVQPDASMYQWDNFGASETALKRILPKSIPGNNDIIGSSFVSNPWVKVPISMSTKAISAYAGTWMNTITAHAPGWTRGISKYARLQGAAQLAGVVLDSGTHIKLLQKYMALEITYDQHKAASLIHGAGMGIKLLGTGLGAAGGAFIAGLPTVGFGATAGAVAGAVVVGSITSAIVDHAEKKIYNYIGIK
ncbi:RHS repeat-associated core domain-containing protein [Candidatus Omnitrophota bacterium]